MATVCISTNVFVCTFLMMDSCLSNKKFTRQMFSPCFHQNNNSFYVKCRCFSGDKYESMSHMHVRFFPEKIIHFSSIYLTKRHFSLFSDILQPAFYSALLSHEYERMLLRCIGALALSLMQKVCRSSKRVLPTH